ncbi:MAG TPA: hypothetical protein VJ725_03055 [Thermoanaerobaculia bacterium]|nr:hypothetical protein [Thermoanaerobaculia bacterium]
METLQGVDGVGAAEVRNRLLDVVARYTGGEEPSDDRTLVVMKYLGGKWGEGSYISSVSPSVE